MGFLKLLSSLFTPSPQRPSRFVLPLRVQCQRCGEILTGEVNLANDLSVEYTDSGGVATYVCRKVIIGTQRCFQPVEVALTFSPQRKRLTQEVTGGTLLPEDTARPA